MLDFFLAGLDACLVRSAGSRILVALSGGSDSVALLHLCRRAASERRIEVAACHVHHHVREAEADRDVQFCIDLCHRLGVSLAVRDLDPENPKGRSPEEWWREQRYRLLEEQRREMGFDHVATAHTKDDQAETFLLKLLRGSGPRGLAGIRRCAGRVIRPLLGVEREKLQDFLVEAGERWVEDSTNRGTEAPRGWVRWVLLPLLETRNPSIRNSLAELSRTLAEEDEFFAGLLNQAAGWPRLGKPLPLADVARLPGPLRSRWILALASSLPLQDPPNRKQIALLERLLEGDQPAAVDLGRRWVLRRRGRHLVVEPPPCPSFLSRPMNVPGERRLPGGFRVRVGLPPEGAAHATFLDQRICNLPLSWRSLLPGERLAPPDGRLVRPILAGLGIPSSWRRAWPVLEAGGTMIWVPGAGVAAGWLADRESGMLAEMEEPWKRHGKSLRQR